MAFVEKVFLACLDQIKQESKSEAFKKHWILPQCKRNARKAKKRKEDAP